MDEFDYLELRYKNFLHQVSKIVDVRIGRLHLIIGSVYFPPGSNVTVYESHCQALEAIIAKSSYSDILIVGDFNLPHTLWYNIHSTLHCDIDECCHMSEQANTILCYFNEFNLYQMNTFKNQYGNMLDLVFTSLTDLSIRCASEVLVECDPYHPALT